jgi:hypothetical protein
MLADGILKLTDEHAYTLTISIVRLEVHNVKAKEVLKMTWLHETEILVATMTMMLSARLASRIEKELQKHPIKEMMYWLREKKLLVQI